MGGYHWAVRVSREEEGGVWEATIGLSVFREEGGMWEATIGLSVSREEEGGMWEVTIELSESVQGRRGRGMGGDH